MAIDPAQKGALTKAKRTTTGRTSFVEARKPGTLGDYYSRCALTNGTSVRKGRAQYVAPRVP